MSDSQNGLVTFLRHWFSGLMAGLEQIDGNQRTSVLRECGIACARSYPVTVFLEAKREGGDLAGFLSALTEKFSASSYEMIGPSEIRVEYLRCACDFVEQGIVQSPLFCECSAHSLKECFEQALGVSVQVTLESTILDGSRRCSFLVSLDNEPLGQDS